MFLRSRGHEVLVCTKSHTMLVIFLPQIHPPQYGRSRAAHTSIEETKEFLDSMIESPYNGVFDFAVCLPDPTNATGSLSGYSSTGSDTDTEGPGIVIGKAGIWDGKEIGFIFNREYWGKGYAFEALDAIIKHYWSINDDASAVIKADVDPRNRGCLKVLEKLGFVEVGRAEKTFETHIGWCDSVYLEARRSS